MSHTFTIAKFDAASGQYGERYCPYDSPENRLCDDAEDAMGKARFAFEDAGCAVRTVSGEDFEVTAADGQTEEYRVFLSDAE